MVTGAYEPTIDTKLNVRKLKLQVIILKPTG